VLAAIRQHRISTHLPPSEAGVAGLTLETMVARATSISLLEYHTTGSNKAQSLHVKVSRSINRQLERMLVMGEEKLLTTPPAMPPSNSGREAELSSSVDPTAQGPLHHLNSDGILEALPPYDTEHLMDVTNVVPQQWTSDISPTNMPSGSLSSAGNIDPPLLSYSN
jgi:hypothetical protein